jgi:hypothetical protein
MALQLDYRFTPGDTLRFLCPFAFTLLYISIPKLLLRRLTFILAIIPVFLFSGAVATCCLYTACILYELLFSKDKWKYCTPLWLLAVILMPYIWQLFFLTPDEKRFNLFSYPLTEGVKYLPYLLLAFIPLCFIIIKLILNREWFGKIFSIFTIAALLGCGYYLFHKTYNRLEEQKFEMSMAISQNNWTQALKISERVKNPDQQTVYLINLALSMKGELAQKLFNYPQTDEYGLLLFRTKDDFSLRYGCEVYYHIGLLNEAIRWIFDSNIAQKKGMDYHTLTRLAMWNKENGYEPVSAKYFDILETTLMYRSWAKRQRNAAVSLPEESPMNWAEYYIGGREPFADLAGHYEYVTYCQENNPKNSMILDYLLCGLLLKNNLEAFLNLFNMCYPHSAKEIPQAYQEALLYIAAMEKIDIKNYSIHSNNFLRFNTFNDLLNRGKAVELKNKFGNTWWYYSCKKSK